MITPWFDRSFIKRWYIETSGISSDNEWQQVVQWMQLKTTCCPTSDNKWQQLTSNGNEWYDKWKQMRANKLEWLYVLKLNKRPICGKVKQELQVQIHQLQVQIHQLRVKIYEFRVQIHKLQFQIHELRVKTYELEA